MRDGQPEPGDVIADKYRVEHVLGRGGMGTVYCVVHQQTGKRLALKCLLPAHVDKPSVVERFLREAKAVGRIQHRHVIDVFDQGRDGDVLYIVLPLLDGKALDDLLKQEKLTLEEALVILVRAMEGVAAAHAHGVLHRDLKPGNIFVCIGVSGRIDDPRVLDFGISKLDGELETLTRSGVAVGTPYYMPFEQLTGQRDLDVRVDVYAMGVILYEAMAGVVPHTAENVAALAIRLMHIPPVHLAMRRPDLPAGLADVVMRALARDRRDRYPSMRALIDAILPFVPASARLTTREPTGRPLRTPRDATEPAVAHDELMSEAAATRAPSPLAPAAASTAPQQAHGSLAPPRPRRSTLALGALGLLAGVAWTTESLLRQPAHRPAVPAREPGESSGALFSPTDAANPAPEPARGSPMALAPLDAGGTNALEWDSAAGAPSLPRAAGLPTTRRAWPARAAKLGGPPSGDAGSATPNQRAAEPANNSSPAKSEPTRAGSLAPDEF